MSGYMATILVADDDPDIAELVELHLAGEGFRVFKAYDGAEALNIFGREKIDLAILDIMMPGVDGIQVCKRIREFSTIPVIMLSARDSEEDKVAGLEIGADDYVTKPFQKGELAARVKSQLRRYQRFGAQDPAEKRDEIRLENLFETAPAFGACFIALFLFQRWSIQTPLLALFRAAIHWLSSLSCIYAINIHITENRKPHRTNMVCLFNDFNYAAGYFAPNNILRCIMI